MGAPWLDLKEGGSLDETPKPTQEHPSFNGGERGGAVPGGRIGEGGEKGWGGTYLTPPSCASTGARLAVIFLFFFPRLFLWSEI